MGHFSLTSAQNIRVGDGQSFIQRSNNNTLLCTITKLSGLGWSCAEVGQKMIWDIMSSASHNNNNSL